jgi:hypothetical protein
MRRPQQERGSRRLLVDEGTSGDPPLLIRICSTDAGTDRVPKPPAPRPKRAPQRGTRYREQTVISLAGRFAGVERPFTTMVPARSAVI